MEIHQLRYFVAVAEEGSFSNAAQREHVSQPSLSQQIHKLEEELNQQLFDRLPRSVVLTEAGRSLLPYARVILTALADAAKSVTALEGEVAGRLSVGAIPSIALYILPRLIGRFQQAYPKVTFELFEDTTEKLAQRLEDGCLPGLEGAGSFEYHRGGTGMPLCEELGAPSEELIGGVPFSRIAGFAWMRSHGPRG